MVTIVVDMKTKCLLILFTGFLGIDLFGHDIPVHWGITVNAAASALGSSPAYQNFLSIVSSDCSLFTATNSMVIGSGFEDNINKPGDIGGERSLNHFYDPLDKIYGKGLSDSLGFEDLVLNGDKRVLAGTNSFAWASISNCTGINFPGERVLFNHVGANINTMNIWSWQNARYYEWLGLTTTNSIDRNSNLTNMFRAIGQVMHLLEDTSQPQHVRNEQHFDPFDADSWAERHDPWASPIEIYGNRKHGSLLNYQQGMLDWRDDGFVKLEDFWDRHLYNGSSAAALTADVGGGAATLGLAEWSNGNFIGDRHSYAEYFPTNDIRYYPYPSIVTGTDFKNWVFSRTVQGAFKDTEYLKNGASVNRIYLQKISDGVSVQHHSVVNYIGARVTTSLTGQARTVATSIRSDNVLRDYHSLLIPRAVKYSAGLLDYYFRGNMVVSQSLSDSYVLTNTVINISGQDFYSGTFYLLQDSNGVRTVLQPYDFTGCTLSNNCTTNFIYSGIISSNTTFLMVYQGTIGVTNISQPLDPVDAGIAIATGTYTNQNTTLTNYIVPVSTIGGPGCTNIGTLYSGEFPFNLVPGQFQATVNIAYFDDEGTIGSLQSAGPSMSCNYGNEITNSIIPISDLSISPDGRHLQVQITATDDPACGGNVGWGLGQDVSITWKAWVPPLHL